MARRVFFSFHYKPDNWRASQVRNMGVVEGNAAVSDNDWETITKGGDEKIKKWINNQLDGKSCAIVLIGENTAGRKWIKYEIEHAWNSNRGVLGIYVHRLKDADGNQANKGSNPFAGFTLYEGKTQLKDIVKTYDPPYYSSKDVYSYISQHIEDWVEDAIKIRANL